MADESTSHIKRISEISIAVSDTESALADMSEVLGLSYDDITVENEPPVQARFSGFHLPGTATFGVMSSTQEGSPIDRFIGHRGEGIFSISLEVDDVEATMRDWEAKGIEFVLPKPMVSSGRVSGDTWREIKFNFTRPNSKLHGVVFEIQELHK
jgi:catechol 2,3-dioxygenase-like lactoylglutathione lyase family enzyme